MSKKKKKLRASDRRRHRAVAVRARWERDRRRRRRRWRCCARGVGSTLPAGAKISVHGGRALRCDRHARASWPPRRKPVFSGLARQDRGKTRTRRTTLDHPSRPTAPFPEPPPTVKTFRSFATYAFVRSPAAGGAKRDARPSRSPDQLPVYLITPGHHAFTLHYVYIIYYTRSSLRFVQTGLLVLSAPLAALFEMGGDGEGVSEGSLNWDSAGIGTRGRELKRPIPFVAAAAAAVFNQAAMNYPRGKSPSYNLKTLDDNN